MRTNNFDNNFPSVTSFLGNDHVLALRNGKCPRNISLGFSGIIARYECISNSRDLRRLIYLFNRRQGIRRGLKKLVAKLKTEWKDIIDDEVVKETKKRIERGAKDYLKNVRKVWSYSRANRWRKALRYTMANYTVYDGPRVERITNLRAKVQAEKILDNPKIDKPLVKVESSSNCQDKARKAERQRVMATKLAAAIESARAAEIVSDEPEIEVGPRNSIRYYSDRSIEL